MFFFQITRETILLLINNINEYYAIIGVKADFQSSHEAPRSSLRVHA
jgi:hypothetical protein